MRTRNREVIVKHKLYSRLQFKSFGTHAEVNELKIQDLSTCVTTTYRVAGSPPPKHGRPLVVGALKR